MRSQCDAHRIFLHFTDGRQSSAGKPHIKCIQADASQVQESRASLAYKRPMWTKLNASRIFRPIKSDALAQEYNPEVCLKIINTNVFQHKKVSK